MKFNLFLLSAAAMVNAASADENIAILGDVILGDAEDYAILAKSGISATAGSDITGSIAVSPIAATAITGFSLALDSGGFFSTSPLLPNYQVKAASYGGATAAALTTAVSDMETAYTDAAGRPTGTTFTNAGTGDDATVQLFNAEYGKVCVGSVDGNTAHRNCVNTDDDPTSYVYENLHPFLNLNLGEIGGLKLAPGVYTFDKQVNISAGDVTFVGDEDDVFIIQTSKGVRQADGENVVLEDNAGILSTAGNSAYSGPQAKNIFWSVAGNVVVGEGSIMEGVLLVKTDITIKNGSTVNGRILAQTAVALQEAIIVEKNPTVAAD
jgi:hypothetical protein